MAPETKRLVEIDGRAALRRFRPRSTIQGVATTTCQHGLPASECLICPTLARTATATAGPGVVTSKGRRSKVTPTASGLPVERPGTHRSVGLHVAGVVAVLAVIGVVAWIVAGVVFALLHILELVAVAGVAAWAGYRIGHFRGSRQRRQ